MKKKYDWGDNRAKLEEHTKKKHDILQRYFRQYLITRCQLPQQEKFRLAVIDGFSGAGYYNCGSYGSPLIFIDTLINVTNEMNLHRETKGFRLINIECLLILNDVDTAVIDLLSKNIAPQLIKAKENCQRLSLEVIYLNSSFEKVYPKIKNTIQAKKFKSVIFNLDQCGYSHVNSLMIRDVLNTWASAEVLLTFMIGSLLAYLSPTQEASNVPLEAKMIEKINALIQGGDELLNKKQWLGEAEKIVYSYLNSCATYVTPFSINNPGGWHYWLMHFANVPKARQVFNDILHQDGASQAHFGRSGLNMLAYDPQHEGQLYLFDDDSRILAKEALIEDIPRFVTEHGKQIRMSDFYAKIYSETPAHSDDIHKAIIDNTELHVITETGGKRRSATSIHKNDILKLNKQRSIFFGKKSFF